MLEAVLKVVEQLEGARGWRLDGEHASTARRTGRAVSRSRSGIRWVMSRPMLVVVFGLAAACGAKDPGPPAGGSGGAPSAGSGSAAAVAAADAGAAVDAAAVSTAADKLPEIKEGYGLVVTDPAGGTLPMTMDDGKTYAIADGTLVEITDRVDGSLKDETTPIAVAGKRGRVATANMITTYDGAAVTGKARSPKDDFLLVTVAIGCGDFCHAALWLLNGPKRHWKVSDNVVLPVIAWRPDNGELAFDNGGVIAIVELPSGKPLPSLEAEGSPVVSPAYSPSGTLFVRNDDAAVFEVAGGKLKKVGQGKKPKRDEEGMSESPQPVEFNAKGEWKLPDGEKPAHRPKKKQKKPAQ
jgi:hypothetical protein